MNKKSKNNKTASFGNTLLDADWIPVEKQLPEFGKSVLILTDYGKMDVCQLRLEDNRILIWYNDMRPQHTNGDVIAWIRLPDCSNFMENKKKRKWEKMIIYF